MQWPDTIAASPGAVAGSEPGTAVRTAGNGERIAAGGVVASPAAVTGAAGGAVYGGPELPCQSEPDLFFAEAPEDVESAKALCQGCAVRLACLGGAVERREPWGVWGGELFLRGQVVPRKRPRGRPRKTEVAA